MNYVARTALLRLLFLSFLPVLLFAAFLFYIAGCIINLKRKIKAYTGK